jgi:peptidoglycan L-alanyl-D-glutamate endopeptidase CwlK
MIDKVSIDRLKLLHPALREEAIDLYHECCEALTGRAILRISYGVRTWKEQDDLWAIGRSIPGKIVTNAKGGESYHNYGLAVDIVLLLDKDGNGTFESASWETNVDFDGDGMPDWMEIVRIFKKYGWECGIDWKFRDAPHFQKSFGLSINELLKRYNEKKVDQNNYVKIYQGL